MGIFETWNAMPWLPKIYWAVAVISSIAFVIIFGMSLLGSGGDSDTDTDGDADGDTDAGSFILSLKSIIGFLVAASWIGIVTINNGLPFWITILASLSAGAIMTTIIVLLLTFFTRMQYNGTLATSDTIGATGEVYLSIPPTKSGKGKVQINVQSAVRTYDAVTFGDEELHQHDKIIVKAVDKEDVLIVEKIS
ncbi:MAG: hypothetical protein J6Z01_11755 [Bacteroidales bacterium]|nr:hypothetical protein [Bacteroidales bacterium]